MRDNLWPGEHLEDDSELVIARVGAVGVYATPAHLRALRRLRLERSIRTALTLVGSLLLVPVAFLIPPHLEPAVVVFLAGIYFTRRAWVAEWVVREMNGICPRCGATLLLKHGTVLYLPHSMRCVGCKAECWLETGAAPMIDDAIRTAAMEKATARPARSELSGRPPLTWSPAASDWRDRKR